MNMVKSLLLGTAAGFAALTGAQAADLPGKAAVAPAAYVRVCSAYGNGFFYIPGTETCLRVGGFVRAQYAVTGPRANTTTANLYGGYAMGYLTFDARSNTEYGTLRGFTAIYGASLGDGPTGHPIGADYAFIQFGGLTAGVADSFFELYYRNAQYINYVGSPAHNQPMVLAYTAQFGGGVSATLALENPSFIRQGSNVSGTANAGLVYAGLQMPDVVAQVRVDQGWGTFHIAGLLHEVRGWNTGAAPSLAAPIGSATGWAVLAGVRLNMNSVAAGDQFWLQGAYAKGAVNRITQIGGYTAVGTATNYADGYVNAAGGVSLSTGWNLFAQYLHFWTPAFRTFFYGSYSNVDQPAAWANNNYRAWNIGMRNVWSPVTGLDMGLELNYGRLDARPTLGGASTKTDSWSGVLRIQRNF